MLNQYAVDYPHVPSQPAFFPPYRDQALVHDAAHCMSSKVIDFH